MNFSSDVRLVFATFRARKMRSFLTMLGVVIGVAGVIIIIALGAGAQSLVLSQITKLGSNLLGVLPGKSNEVGPPTAVFGVQVTTLTKDDAQALLEKARAPHIVGVVAFSRGPGTVVWDSRQVDTFFAGMRGPYLTVRDVEVEEGRFFDTQEEESGALVMVLGYDIRQLLFGNTDPIGEVVKIKNVPFRVIGVMKERGTAAFQNLDDTVYIPLSVAQRQLLGINHLQQIQIKVDRADHLKSTTLDVEAILRERHHMKNPEDDDFTVRDLADAVKLLTNITNALRLFLVAMAAIALVVGGIGIMNIMLVTVRERTAEIGLRMAVGATRATVRNQFLLESCVLTLFGGVGGTVIGVLIAYVIALGARYAGYEWEFVIAPWSVAVALGVSAATGIIFGYYPAQKASKLNPIEALRYE